MDDRQIKFGLPNKAGRRRGHLVSDPGFIPDMARINSEGQLPDVDDDADDGRFGADPPMVQAMYAGAALDPDPGPSISIGDMRQYSSGTEHLDWRHWIPERVSRLAS